jgi:hypothetical protein
MRRGRIISGVIALTIAAAIAAPGALAGPPAISQGYGPVVPKVTPKITPTNTAGVAGAQHALGTRSPLRATTRSGALPFTGAQLWLFALVGIALIGGGAMLKTTARSESRS